MPSPLAILTLLPLPGLSPLRKYPHPGIFGVRKPLLVYYEVFRLERDIQGKTRYNIQSEIRTRGENATTIKVVGGPVVAEL